jgi:hypothetical protein
MTVTGHLGYMPDLTRLYERCSFIPYWWVGEGIVKIQYGDNAKGICTDDILHTSTKTKKRFFNQSSLVFRLLFEGSYKETNIKMFKNGGFQMTGISSEAMARASLERLIEMNFGRGIWISEHDSGSGGTAETNTSMRTPGSAATSDHDSGSGGTAEANKSTISYGSAATSDHDSVIKSTISPGSAATNTPIEEPKEPKPFIKKFDICMMNSDYTINKAIKRDQLYKILVEKYGLWSSFEPTIYQGVNTKFFWNKARPASAPAGICVCPTPCEGGGSGYGIGNCKKITISPFRTGSIIITGAKHTEQLYDAYNFINTVLREHADTVLRGDAPQLEVAPKPSRSKKPVAPPSSTEGILRQKMRASPRNVVRLPVV